jgi:small subunit ribosomal protein S16
VGHRGAPEVDEADVEADDGEDAALVAVKIRLMRMGKKRQPTYRVVVADARSPRDGRFIEIIGTYAPRQEPSGVSIDAERARYWLGQGAQVTDRVRKLLALSGSQAPGSGSPTSA